MGLFSKRRDVSDPDSYENRLISLETAFSNLEERFVSLRSAVIDDMERALTARQRAVAAESSTRRRKGASEDAPGGEITTVDEYKRHLELNGGRIESVERALGL